MRDLPTGTVTSLFTDVEGSTRLLAELGDEYAAVLAEHRRVLRAAVTGYHGVEVDTQGDAFFIVFSDAPDAVAAADAALLALAASPLKVRIGIHTGHPTLAEEGYVGLDVHRAARICAVAHGGQAVLSDSTRRLLDPGVDLSDLGLHRLKDLPEPERLYQLGSDMFPPLRSLNATNLPSQPSALIGREREIDELVSHVRSDRLTTLTGAGGSGKTRLALEVAAELVGDFPDGVFWVPLAAVSDPTLMEPEIGQVLGARGTLAAHVDEKRMLLLLDNLEQLLEGAPALADLIAACPNLHLLVTSRAPLRIAGEQEFLVEPLPDVDAVELFRERAFQLDRPETVSEICRRLDGLPLAIELAAARTRLLSPDQLLLRLDRSLPLLTSGRRDAPARQQTLQATIAWSHDLLAPDERQLFARLAVFSGGFTVESAEEICETEPETLGSLVEQSLVYKGENRLGMLETIREFALARLEESDEQDRIRRRHAEWCLALVRSANVSSESSGEERPGLLLGEQDNIRAALTWALDADETDLGLELTIALELSWHVRNPFELLRWLDALAPELDQLSLPLRARVLRVRGGGAEMSGNWPAGERAYQESLLAYRMLDDQRGIADLQTRLAESARRQGDLGRARALAEEAVQTARRIRDRRREAPALGILGEIEYQDHNQDIGLGLIERSADMAGENGFIWWQGVMLGTLASYARTVGRANDARRWQRESLELLHQIGDRQNILESLTEVACDALDSGRLKEAGLLWGAVESEEARAPLGWWAEERTGFEETLLASPTPSFERGRAEGRGLTLDEAVWHALETLT